jgi:hypothetical protein
MSHSQYQAALPSRYFWHAAVGSDTPVKQYDPSGQITASQNNNRPAIGFVSGTTGALAYTDSMGKTVWMPVVTAGVYYPADIKVLLAAGHVYPAETGSETDVTTTVYKLTLFWAP